MHHSKQPCIGTGTKWRSLAPTKINYYFITHRNNSASLLASVSNSLTQFEFVRFV